jgi:hypothetical protein
VIALELLQLVLLTEAQRAASSTAN